MTSETLAAALGDFLSGSSGAVVIEDGGVTFDLTQAKYSILGENNKCLLHLGLRSETLSDACWI
jgi:hypothetical protein